MEDALIEFIIQNKNINREKLEELFQRASELGESIDQTIIKKGLFTEHEMLTFYSDYLDLAYYESLAKFSVPEEFVENVSVAFARNYNLVGLEKTDGEMLVATCRPLQLSPMDELSNILGVSVKPVLAPRVEISALINKAYQARNDLIEDTMKKSTKATSTI